MTHKEKFVPVTLTVGEMPKPDPITIHEDKITFELLPCPFCGAKANLGRDIVDDDWSVCCTNQNCKAIRFDATFSDAITGWNGRVQ